MPNFMGNPDHPITLLAFVTLLVVLVGAVLYLRRFNRRHADPLNEKRDAVEQARRAQGLDRRARKR